MKYFNGNKFKMWFENDAASIESLHLDTVRLNDGKEGPMGEGNVACDGTGKSMYKVDFMGTSIKAGGVALTTAPNKYNIPQPKHRGADSQGKRAWDALDRKCRFETDEIIWKLIDELRCIKMTTINNLHEYIHSAEQLRSDRAVHNL